ncbi:MAG: phosphoribosylformylglycinamidine synthase [Oscillospiraceae bacterium]|nr:phosphoribosylformylglycinamidine synthase [Oscillospiraceae bacterium]
MAVYRIFSEKKQELNSETKVLQEELLTALGIYATQIRIINRFDVEGITEEQFKKAIPVIFSDKNSDEVYDQLPEFDTAHVCAIEFLPGQYDVRTDNASQGLNTLFGIDMPVVKYAKIYTFSGITDEEFTRIKKYMINPIETRECSLIGGDTSAAPNNPEKITPLNGFNELSDSGLSAFLKEHGLAMDIDDITFCQNYFKTENRQPTITEIRIIDTYWSDHCRHTTFGTVIDSADIQADYIQETYNDYLKDKAALGRSEKPITLMDIATTPMRRGKSDGTLINLDESDEINACTVKVKVDVNNQEQDWLLLFKNETHNHPTEIEPFGGAATCLGGGIRDPLSGRSWVYQAMRITGASDPLLPVEKTIKGKLPPRKITKTAAAGYSSYGNQVGLASGLLCELYHPGYMAKRMELGALVGAVKAENVVRITPTPGDAVILLGGRTGRDGCGGATGSSREQDADSLATLGAEVQKGTPMIGRKLQRLFRNPEVSRLIKKCNDFGAGGVSVAIGELADGLDIDLNAVPVKYAGLSGTEIAVSESQERMAVVIDKSDVERFISLADRENLEASVVAHVTEEKRMKMTFNDEVICDLSREFLNSNGAVKHTTVSVPVPEVSYEQDFNTLENMAGDLNICSQKGISSRFDSTVGANTVLMPFSGKTQSTPVQAMAAKFPVLDGETNTASIMSWGGNPYIMCQSPYHGAALSVLESVARVVASGGSYKDCYLSFQEYFEATKNNPARWGKPFSALLGAYKAQIGLGLASIGGKDSMSGSYEDIDVPPALFSFAVTTQKADRIISAEFKKSGRLLQYIAPNYDKNNMPIWQSVKRVFEIIEREIASGNAASVWALGTGGIGEAVFKMSLGNQVGAELVSVHPNELYTQCYGAFVIEAVTEIPEARKIGKTIEEFVIDYRPDGWPWKKFDLTELKKVSDEKLEPIFKNTFPINDVPIIEYNSQKTTVNYQLSTVNCLIPAFPGSNGEYDMAQAFNRAGGKTNIFVVRNLTGTAVRESVAEFVKQVNQSQIIALPGGFSSEDNPGGSGNYTTAFLSNPEIMQAINELLKRDGLILGIGNGFSALQKLGLLAGTLTFNEIGRQVSQMANVRVCSVKSPWLNKCKVGEVYNIPVSSAEGRFTADETVIQGLIENGQVAGQFTECNPFGSAYAIESISSQDGRILGMMGHPERYSPGCFKNVDGNKDMPLFEAGVEWFK